MNYEIISNNLIEVTCENFVLSQTLDCGQAFRWSEIEKNVWHGVAHNHFLRLSQNDDKILFHCSVEDFENIWIDYFDLNRNYADIIKIFSKDKILKEATTFSPGIRLLKQNPWETTCSFIISQNNNIPRIKGIIKNLCETFGEPLGNNNFSFPSAQTISKLSIGDLAVIQSGFRAKYIIDAAEKISDGIVDFKKIEKLSTEEAEKELLQIYGVGKKVAQCILLFGFRKFDAFPIDVWIKKILAELYPQGLPKYTLELKGIAQQYLFHYVRYNHNILKN